MIVVFDASTLVSALLKEDSIPQRALMTALAAPNRFIVSDEVEAEYREVLNRPKFARAISAERRHDMLRLVFSAAHKIAVIQPVHECEDPKDDKYLALAASGHADVIVSSDRHLTKLHPWRGKPILGPADVLTRVYLDG